MRVLRFVEVKARLPVLRLLHGNVRLRGSVLFDSSKIDSSLEAKSSTEREYIGADAGVRVGALVTFDFLFNSGHDCGALAARAPRARCCSDGRSRSADDRHMTLSSAVCTLPETASLESY